MGIAFTLSNILQLFSAISPLLLTFFLVMASIFNQNIKGLIYIAGLLIATGINILLMGLVKSERSTEESVMCNIIDIPILREFNNPSPGTLFIGFTLAYLLLPMTYNGQMNYMILISLICLLTLDVVTRVQKQCTTWLGAIVGAAVGFGLGSLWYTILHSSGYDSLLFFDEVNSNNVVCSKPSKQTFKCSVYKNGELISSNIA